MMTPKVSTVPSYQDELTRVKSFIRESNSLALVSIDVSRMGRIEKLYGTDAYTEVLGSLKEILFEMRGREIRTDDLITEYGIGGQEFLIFLSRKRKDRGFYPTDLENVARRISSHLDQRLFDTARRYLKTRPKIAVGHAIAIFNPLIQGERQIYKLIDDAKKMAHYQQFREAMRGKEKIQELIIKEAITTVFQPIIRLENYALFGYEALTRGPAGTEFESPSFLFEVSQEIDLDFELDRFCRRKAFENARSVGLNHRLFVNCLPATIRDPEFRGKNLENLLADLGLTPSQIVMEISEKYAIENYEKFRAAVHYYKELGFSIAIDDTGAGHSSLEAVVELCPDILKLDLSLIHEIHNNPVKKELASGIVRLANSIQCKVVAEGIESQGELECVLDIGVMYGQGFYIGRPSSTLIPPVKK